jgi:hypothetical protein
MSDNLSEARLKLADDFSHADGAQDFDVVSICRACYKIERKSQDGDERPIHHKSLPVPPNDLTLIHTLELLARSERQSEE